MGKENQITNCFERHPNLRLRQETMDELVGAATRARKKAHAPYSGYEVGAALLFVVGENIAPSKISTGQNIEGVTFTLTMHAEEIAAWLAYMATVMQGVQPQRGYLKALAVVHEGNSMPCGLCRQVLQEFCNNMVVINASPEGKIREIGCLSELLPEPFGPKLLGIK